MKHRVKSLERQLFYVGLGAVPVGTVVFWLYYVVLSPLWPFQGCIWDVVFRIYCPGCGGTRALSAFFRGELLLSLQYHPAVAYGIIVYGVFMLSQFMSVVSRGRLRGIRFHGFYLYAAVIIILVNCLVRNYLRIRYGITI